jgi:hypothetical protein
MNTDEIYTDMLNSYGDTLEKISEDTSKRVGEALNGVFMTTSQQMAVNFDKYKDHFSEMLSLSEHPMSCDAFLRTPENELFLIEFKNGRIQDKEMGEIRQKIYDSLLILLEKLDKTIAFARNNLSFILIYNPEAVNRGKNRIRNSLFERSQLRRFERYCFRRVHAYSESEFESQLVSKYLV